MQRGKRIWQMLVRYCLFCVKALLVMSAFICRRKLEGCGWRCASSLISTGVFSTGAAMECTSTKFADIAACRERSIGIAEEDYAINRTEGNSSDSRLHKVKVAQSGCPTWLHRVHEGACSSLDRARTCNSAADRGRGTTAYVTGGTRALLQFPNTSELIFIQSSETLVHDLRCLQFCSRRAV